MHQEALTAPPGTETKETIETQPLQTSEGQPNTADFQPPAIPYTGTPEIANDSQDPTTELGVLGGSDMTSSQPLQQSPIVDKQQVPQNEANKDKVKPNIFSMVCEHMIPISACLDAPPFPLTHAQCKRTQSY